MQKPKIEAIFPLTFMQQTLLFHSISESNDQGFLQVQCKLKGSLDFKTLKDAWQKAIQRHPVLRTSIHWQNIEKPLQVVHPSATLTWQNKDWSRARAKEQNDQLTRFKNDDRKIGLDISSSPVSRITLIKLSQEEYIMIWSCHHILLDGWSATIIFRDVFTFYKAVIENKEAKIQAIPSYKSYLNWYKQQDFSKAEHFWNKALNGFNNPGFFSIGNSLFEGTDQFKVLSIILTQEETAELQKSARESRLTLNTLFQGIWSLLLSRFFESPDVAFGRTVSGRSADLPNIELMAGLFMNVLPVRAQLEPTSLFNEWLTQLQKQQIEVLKYEQISLAQINSWSGRDTAIQLFDSLMVFENFPWENIENGGIRLEEFEGGLTSTYPLTIILKPGESFEIRFRYDSKGVDIEIVNWLIHQFERILKSFRGYINSPLETILESIAPPPKSFGSGSNIDNVAKSRNKDYIYKAPQNALQLKLAKIWEQVFGRQEIGITDNFFEIGGRSITAVRLLSQIEKELGYNLSPAALLQNPTIERLAGCLSEGRHSDSWSSVVPLRVSGSKTPLFCVHAGGGHVFFYNALANRLGKDQPVYAMQPVGLDGLETYHKSIEEMAAHYIEEVRTIQPEGPYALLGHCFSTAVSLEMARQLKQMGQDILMLAIIDSVPERKKEPVPNKRNTPIRTFTKMILNGERNNTLDRLDGWIKNIEKKWTLTYGNSQTKNLLMIQDVLKRLYHNYDWNPYPGDIHLFIRSHRPEKHRKVENYIQEWSPVVQGDINIVEVQGRHHTLFEEPEVHGLAQKINESLAASINQLIEK